MTEQELRLECLKIAVQLSPKEPRHGSITLVGDASRLYEWVTLKQEKKTWLASLKDSFYGLVNVLRMQGITQQA